MNRQFKRISYSPSSSTAIITVTILLLLGLAACGPDRAQTIAPPPAATSTLETAAELPTEAPAAATTAPSTTTPPEQPTTPPDPPPPSDVDEEALLAALLTLEDMPTGWTGTSPEFEQRTPGGTYSSFCTELEARSIAAATVDFQKSAFGPLLTENIVVYPDNASASAAFDDLLEAAQNCTEMVDDAGNVNKFSPLSFPAIGDDTFAMRSSGLVELDLINIRSGNVIISIMHGGLGAVDSAQTETFVRAAYDRYR